MPNKINRTWSKDLEKDALTNCECPLCGAYPGVDCLTPRGFTAHHTHPKRIEAARQLSIQDGVETHRKPRAPHKSKLKRIEAEPV